MLRRLANPIPSKRGLAGGEALWVHLKTLDRCVGKVYVAPSLLRLLLLFLKPISSRMHFSVLAHRVY
jgi:hypothetical protein